MPPTSWVIDPLGNTSVRTPISEQQRQKAIVTVASEGFEDMLWVFLSSLRDSGTLHLQDTEVFVINLDYSDIVDDICDKFKTNMLDAITLGKKDSRVKSVMYAMGKVLPHDQLLLADCDILFRNDACLIWSHLKGGFAPGVYCSYDLTARKIQRRTGSCTLGTLMKELYRMSDEECEEAAPDWARESNAAINDGVILATKDALNDVYLQLREMKPSVKLLNRQLRNQMIFNAAAILSGDIRPLPDEYNCQSTAPARRFYRGEYYGKEVDYFSDPWNPNSVVKMYHFAGRNKPSQKNWDWCAPYLKEYSTLYGCFQP